jgi:ABC-2 type transport system permease protein
MNTMVMLVRREFWEHRSLWIAPLIWVGVIVVLFSWVLFVGARHLDGNSIPGTPPGIHEPGIEMSPADRAEFQEKLRAGVQVDDSRKQTVTTFSFLLIGAMISGFATVVVFFYLIDCLFTERRDRSILFWKSLPISDTQVVLSKLATAMVAVPVGVILLSAATQFLLYCLVWLRFHGTLFGELMPDWDFLSWLRSQGLALGILVGSLLWYAPIAAYFLLLSAWARRLVFLWAVVPLIAIPVLEGIFFHSSKFAQFLSYRFGGYAKLMHLDEKVFSSNDQALPRVEEMFDAFHFSGLFTSADMWLGLVAAAALIYATIRIRRYRDES